MNSTSALMSSYLTSFNITIGFLSSYWVKIWSKYVEHADRTTWQHNNRKTLLDEKLQICQMFSSQLRCVSNYCCIIALNLLLSIIILYLIHFKGIFLTKTTVMAKIIPQNALRFWYHLIWLKSKLAYKEKIEKNWLVKIICIKKSLRVIVYLRVQRTLMIHNKFIKTNFLINY